MSRLRGVSKYIAMCDDNNWNTEETKKCVTCDHLSDTNTMYPDFESAHWCIRTVVPKIVKENHHCGGWSNEIDRFSRKTW